MKKYLVLATVLATGCCTLALKAQDFQFIDKAATFGISGGNQSFQWGGGVSFFDINEDGYDDLVLLSDNTPLRIYLSNGSGFDEITTDIFLQPNSVGVVWVDYDNDGDYDLFLTARGGICQLWQNDGQLNFTDVTESAGLGMPNSMLYGGSFGDFDNDGYLDLYLCRYEIPGVSQGQYTNSLYRNNGDGTFSEITNPYVVGDDMKPSFMAGWIDINNNRFPDLFIINDRLPANTLFKNLNGQAFEDITSTAQVAFPANDPMSITAGDFDNDGDIDIFITNSGNNEMMPVILLSNNGDETFTDVAADMGISIDDITWGATWIDYDNDGLKDLFCVTSTEIPNHLYKNEGASFTYSPELIQAPLNQSYVCASGDYNNNGYSDIIVNNIAPQSPNFLENQGGDKHYVKVRPKGTVSNRQATGTWIHVYHDESAYHRYTLCGENFVGQNSQNIPFGLGSSDAPVDSIVMRFPSGHSDVYYTLPTDSLYVLTEGDSYHAAITALSPFSALCEGDTVLLDGGLHAQHEWSTGDTSRFISVDASGWYHLTVHNEFGVSATDSFQVVIHPLPEVMSTVIHPGCFGGSDGEILLSNQSPGGTGSVAWSNGSTGAFLQGLGAGTYQFEFTDNTGCSTEGEVELVSPPELFALITVGMDPDEDEGTIGVSIFGGSPPYNILINGAEATNFNDQMPPGSYTVTVVDVNGCQYTETVVLTSTLSDNVRDAPPSIRLYPNPCRDFVYVKGDRSRSDIRLFNAVGAELNIAQRLDMNSIDMRDLPAGLYFIRFRFVDGSEQALKVMRH